jgi:hypothetical protein
LLSVSGGAVTGKGADVLIIDDPHSANKRQLKPKANPEIYDKAYEWYTSGPRQRLAAGRSDCDRDDSVV